MDNRIETFTEVRQSILTLIKQEGTQTIAELAKKLAVSYEAVRQQLRQLEHEGWLRRNRVRDSHQASGRPQSAYSLTRAGEHLFPKNYDGLSAELVATLAQELGMPVVRRILAALTDARVAHWLPRLNGLSLPQRLQALRDIYVTDDPFTQVETDGNDYRLVERNCPYLNVALHQPALCSVTVNTLSRLLGCRVTRVERFQHGHARCVFHVHRDQPVDATSAPFALEDESTR